MNIQDVTKGMSATNAEIVKLKVLTSMMVQKAGGKVRITHEHINLLDKNSRLRVREDPEGYYELILEEPE